MKQRLIRTVIASAVAGSLLVGYGCGSDDNGSGSTSDLTPEQQFALINELLDDGGSNTAIIDGLYPLVLSQASPLLWDGVDEGDIDPSFGLEFFGKIVAANLVPLHAGPGEISKKSPTNLQRLFEWGMRALWAQDEVVTYNPATGWWHYELEYSFGEFESAGFYYSVERLDSIRFEDAGGMAQEIPQQGVTARMRYGGSGGVILSEGAGNKSEDPTGMIDASYTNSGVIDGLNSDVVSIDAASMLGLGIEALIPADLEGEEPQKELAADFQVDGVTSGLMIPKTEDLMNICPTAGSFQGGLDADYSATIGNTQSSFRGGWEMGMVIDGDTKTANLTLETGSFVGEQTTSICD